MLRPSSNSFSSDVPCFAHRRHGAGTGQQSTTAGSPRLRLHDLRTKRWYSTEPAAVDETTCTIMLRARTRRRLRCARRVLGKTVTCQLDGERSMTDCVQTSTLPDWSAAVCRLKSAGVADVLASSPSARSRRRASAHAGRLPSAVRARGRLPHDRAGLLQTTIRDGQALWSGTAQIGASTRPQDPPRRMIPGIPPLSRTATGGCLSCWAARCGIALLG